jgi:hypothetical protein
MVAGNVTQTGSSADFAVSVEGLHGIVPFHFTIDRIDIADRDGTYITLHDFGLDISRSALLAGRLEIRSLSFAEIEMARSPTAPSTTPLSGYFEVPRLSRWRRSRPAFDRPARARADGARRKPGLNRRRQWADCRRDGNGRPPLSPDGRRCRRAMTRPPRHICGQIFRSFRLLRACSGANSLALHLFAPRSWAPRAVPRSR